MCLYKLAMRLRPLLKISATDRGLSMWVQLKLIFLKLLEIIRPIFCEDNSKLES
jgi:hypothetical protein